MKVLLLEPFVPDESKWGSFSVEKGYILPLGMLAIYSYLRAKKINTQWIDTQFGDFTSHHLREVLSDQDIKFVGIPVFTNSAAHSFRTATLCKQYRPDITVVFGGVHATILPERTFNECDAVDYIIMGEGEVTFYELIEKLAAQQPVDGILGLAYRNGKGIIKNPPRPFFRNLDDLPMICYDDINLNRYVPHPTQYNTLPCQAFVTQRGCPYPCTFCEASATLGKMARRYSPARVIDELEVLIKKHGTRSIYFQDSTFSINMNYTAELMEKLINADFKISWACNTRADKVNPELLKMMKRAGCWMVNYGVESANQQSLDIFRKCITPDDSERAVKMTKKAGLDVLCNFILCIPGEDEKMVLNTINFAKKLLPDLALFYLPVPFPTSELYNICRKMGGLRENVTWEDFLCVDYDNPVYVNPLIGKEKMKALYHKAYRDFYLNPAYIVKSTFKLRSYDNIKRAFRGLKALSSFLKKDNKQELAC
jgi:radical SAM superfamily enzyme YgiQ (UPF0313 family)